ncbi:MFS transporter [uncultured Dubosiella sp.]|uniref:MFS transporter n=1 Tax=uncultured Dubosiella sp. TaxID=1937011 RepID=UPI0034CEFD31
MFASLSKTQDTAKLIKICILAYFCIACFAIQLDNIVEFWILAGAVGCFQGGIQALSRSYYAKIIPDNASGEYFGLFDICGKGASFLGLLVVGIVTQYTGQQNLGVAALTFMFLIGYFLFAKAAKLEK